MANKNFKELFTEELGKQELTTDQRIYLCKWLRLGDGDSDLSTIMMDIITTFKSIPDYEFSVKGLSEESVPMNLRNKLMISIYEAGRDRNQFTLHDKYLIQLTVHTMMRPMSTYLASKLMGLYHDIKDGTRSLKDVQLDLFLLNRYENKSLSTLFYLIKLHNDRVESPIEFNEATTKELSKRLFVDANKKRYEGHVKINDESHENGDNGNDK